MSTDETRPDDTTPDLATEPQTPVAAPGPAATSTPQTGPGDTLEGTDQPDVATPNPYTGGEPVDQDAEPEL